jgi:hypothetical protein
MPQRPGLFYLADSKWCQGRSEVQYELVNSEGFKQNRFALTLPSERCIVLAIAVLQP